MSWLGTWTQREDRQLDRAARALPELSEVKQAAERVKVVADPTRLRMLVAIRLAEEIAVSDICRMTGIEQTVASHHLAKARRHQLVTSRRWGRLTKYSLTAEGRSLLQAVIPEEKPRT